MKRNLFNATQVQSLATLVSDSLWLTQSCFVDLTDVALNDVTLAYEDANSNLLMLLVLLLNVDAEERVGRHFGRDFEAEGRYKFGTWILAEISKQKSD